MLPTDSDDNMVTSTLITAAAADGMIVDAAVEPANQAACEWTRPNWRGKKSGINTYVKNKVIGEIKNQLDADAQIKKKFEDCCFGKYLHFDHESKGGCPNQAIHAMFGQQVKFLEEKEDELWFRVGENFLRFSKYEYALVTGLRFGPMNFDPNEDCDLPVEGLYMRRMNKDHSVMKFDCLLDRFKQGQFKDQPDDQLKVAKILFVYAILFGVDYRSVIEKWVWVLVEDDEKWENFPWGAYSYRILIKNLKNKVPKEQVDAKAYHLFGYSHAFAYWMFEAIPSLGKLMMEEDTNPVKQRPRSLKWPFNWKRKGISNFFADENNIECHKILKPTPEEISEYDWWPEVDKEIPPNIEHVARNHKVAKKSAVVKSSSDQCGRRRKLPVTRNPAVGSSAAAPLVVVEPPRPDNENRAHAEGHEDSQLIRFCGGYFGVEAAATELFATVSTIPHPEQESHYSSRNLYVCPDGSPSTEIRRASTPVTRNRSPSRSQSPSHNDSPMDTIRESTPNKRARLTDNSTHETHSDLLARLMEGVTREIDNKLSVVIQRVDKAEQNVLAKFDEVDRRLDGVKNDVHRLVDEVDIKLKDKIEGLKQEIAQVSDTVIRGVGSERNEMTRELHDRIESFEQHVTETISGFTQQNIEAPLEEVKRHLTESFSENIAALRSDILRTKSQAGWEEHSVLKRLERIDDQLNKPDSTSKDELIKMIVEEVQRVLPSDDKMIAEEVQRVKPSDDEMIAEQGQRVLPSDDFQGSSRKIGCDQTRTLCSPHIVHKKPIVPVGPDCTRNLSEISLESFVRFDEEFVDQPESFKDKKALYVLRRGPAEPPLSTMWLKDTSKIPYHNPIIFKEKDWRICERFKHVVVRPILRLEEPSSSSGTLTEDEQNLQKYQAEAYRGFKSSTSSENTIDVGHVEIIDGKEMKVEFGREYFLQIENLDIELESSHLDAYLRILHNDPMFVGVNPESAVRFSVLGMQFCDLVKKMVFKQRATNHLKFLKERKECEFLDEKDAQPLLDWVKGKARKGWTKIVPWTEIDMIYTIWYVRDHWTPILINFKTCEVWLFDSLFHRVTTEMRLSRERETLDLRRIIPSLLQKSGFYNTRRNLKQVHREWDIRFAAPGHCFTQMIGSQCGVYSLKTIEVLISRRSVVNVDDSHIKQIRHRIAERIYSYNATARD